MKLSEFYYDLPKELIAQYPLKDRDASRMMVLDRAKRTIAEKQFSDITDCLKKGDTIVLNDVRVIPARLIGKRETGGRAEVFLLEKTGEDSFKALTKPSKKLKNGTKILFDNGITGTVLENSDFGKIIKFSDPDGLADIGRVPLPPYIKREPEALDDERYQTVYARNDGATASPTAGLHFTNDLLGKISRSGIDIAYVTLNVSYGTFAPVLEEDVEKHKMHKEYFRLTEDTADVINKTKERGGRVIAVGTTTTRVLESCGGGKVCPGEGTTDLFIYPGYRFKTVDMMLTNFHLPKSTLLLLVSAFAGTEFIKEAYKKAVERNFRFFSYGDCMFIT